MSENETLIEMWKDTDYKGITASCKYNTENHTYIVECSYNDSIEKDEFTATYEPRFGMDVADKEHSMSLAEDLAIILEQKYNM